MKIRDIYAYLDALSPFENQESWDKSGLLIGSMENEITRIVVSLDIDWELLEQIPPGTLLLVHHPIIFKPLSDLNFDAYPANLIAEMVRRNISLIAMHTNFDLTHLNEYVAREVLGFEEIERDGLVCIFDVGMSIERFARHIATKMGYVFPKITIAGDTVKRASLVTGSGMSMLGQIRTDCYLTGDIKFHDAMAARSLGISLIDIGHYESEIYFSRCLEPHLQKLPIPCIIADSKNPFTNLQEMV